MAMIDYGALLKVNGEFINKNQDLFMDDTKIPGVPKKAFYPKYNEDIDIAGNFYVYAGDEKFMLVFYKTWFYVIKDNTIIKSWWAGDNIFNKEWFNIEGIEISIELLDTSFRKKYHEPFDEFDQECNEYRYGRRKANLLKLRRLKKTRKVSYQYRRNKLLAKWSYNGNDYEVIFGYGVDPNEEVIREIISEGSYEYSEVEGKKILEWFI